MSATDRDVGCLTLPDYTDVQYATRVSSSSDLTARARIRDAAIELFAERGVEAATIRDIAQAAGASSGLLRHHFGSKEGLRDACDEFALSELLRVNAHFTEFRSLDRL